MRFSHLLTQLSEVDEATPCRIGSDPELTGAESVERAGTGQLTFLEALRYRAAGLPGRQPGRLPISGARAVAHRGGRRRHHVAGLLRTLGTLGRGPGR
jgi:hypothetical protein